jgi:hypothetical protein
MWVLIAALVILITTWRMMYKRAAGKGYSPAKTALVGHATGLSVALLISIVFMVVMLEGFKVGDKTAPSAASVKAETAAAPVYTDVDAKTLFQDYDANEVAADEKYKGKLLGVQGKVQSIDKDAFDNVIVRLVTPNQFMGVSGTIKAVDRTTAGSLTKGQTVRLYCEGTGRLIGSPTLKNCFIDSPK